jgi:hypothetical protein
MVGNAKRNRADPAAIQLQEDARASLEAMIQRVKDKLGELGPAVAIHERELAEMAILDARQEIKEGAAADTLRRREVELERILLSLVETPPVGGARDSRGHR